MLKLFLLIVLCTIGYQLLRSWRNSAPPKDNAEQERKRPVDPSRAVEAQFEDVDGDSL